jgi:hypothetical protein
MPTAPKVSIRDTAVSKTFVEIQCGLVGRLTRNSSNYASVQLQREVV